MIVTHSVTELRQAVREAKLRGRRVGFVPTMGALHEGHLSLVRVAKIHSDFVVMSVFLNPTQFNSKADFENYPKTLERDVELAQQAGVDFVFAPSESEMYPRGRELSMTPGVTCRVIAGDRSQGLCGATRPGHFDGVVTVVAILFNQVEPDVAVFGQKDYQQVRVIKQMVEDLQFPIEIIVGDTVRADDGLALSSRNERLSPEGRARALVLSQTLQKVVELVRHGECHVPTLKAKALESLTKAQEVKVDYLEILDADSLAQIEQINGDAQILVAAFVDDVRLIDNMRLSLG